MMETVPQTPEEIARLKAAVASMPIYINALVSPDGKAAAVDRRLQAGRALAELHRAQRGDCARIVDRERDADVDIYLGGITDHRRSGRPCSS